MSVKARCLNYTGCLLAYRGEIIELPDNAPLVCPECAKTVNVVQNKGGGVVKALVGLLVLAAIGAGLYMLAPKLKGFIRKAPPTQESTEPATPVAIATPVATTGGEPTPRGGIATPVTAVSNPSPPTAPAKIDLDIRKAENQLVRDEVLKRIDAIPKLTPQQRDKLTNSMMGAKSMGLVLTIPFGSGNARLPAGEIPTLKAELDKPELMKLRQEFTCVFVVLGYADPKGDTAKNLQISQTRADSVAEAMRTSCKVENVVHSVGMGGSKLLDVQNLEKNRVVEVWAVLPK